MDYMAQKKKMSKNFQTLFYVQSQWYRYEALKKPNFQTFFYVQLQYMRHFCQHKCQFLYTKNYFFPSSSKGIFPKPYIAIQDGITMGGVSDSGRDIY